MDHHSVKSFTLHYQNLSYLVLWTPSSDEASDNLTILLTVIFEFKSFNYINHSVIFRLFDVKPQTQGFIINARLMLAGTILMHFL